MSEFKGVSGTAYNHILASKPEGEVWENFALENIECEEEEEEGGMVFVVTLSWWAITAAAVSGRVQKDRTVKVYKFADDRENIIIKK